MRVLIVDDCPDIAWVHEKIVRMLGHDARRVQNGESAILEAKQFHPDVILLDICMPRLDGWDVAEQLRSDSQTRHIRLVAVTAMTSPECELRSKEAGIDAHFGKPVRLAQWPKVLCG